MAAIPAKLRDDYEPKTGDFLLTKDATPGIAYVTKEHIAISFNFALFLTRSPTHEKETTRQ